MSVVEYLLFCPSSYCRQC